MSKIFMVVVALLLCGSAYGQNKITVDLSKERQVIKDGADLIAKATASGNTAIAEATAEGTADIAKAIREQTASQAGAAAANARAKEAEAKKGAAQAILATETLRQATEKKRIEEQGKTDRAPFKNDAERRKLIKETPPDQRGALQTAVEAYAAKAAEGCQNLDVYVAMEAGRSVGWTSCRDAIHGITRPFKGDPMPPPPPPLKTGHTGWWKAGNVTGVLGIAAAVALGAAAAIKDEGFQNPGYYMGATIATGLIGIGGFTVAAVNSEEVER